MSASVSAPAPPADAPRRATAAWLFAFLLCVYGLTYHGLSLEDGAMHYEAARNLLVRGSLSLPDDRFAGARDCVFWKRGVDGRTYVALAPGQTLAAVPGCALGLWLEGSPAPEPSRVLDLDLAPEAWEEHFRRARARPSVALSFVVNPVATALLGTALFLASGHLGASPRRSLLVALAGGLTTSLWYFATCDWTQPVTALLLFASMLAAWRGAPGAAGALGGLAVAFRYDAALALPWVALALARRRPGALLRFALPLALGAALLGGWNVHRFGSPLDTGSAHQAGGRLFGRDLAVQLPVALATNTVSPRQGLLVFSPVLLVSLAAFPAFLRRHPALGWPTVGLAAGYLLFYSAFLLWQTPESLGPRFLHVVVPFLLLPLAAAPSPGRPARLVAALLAGAGLVVQVLGAAHPVRLETRESITTFALSERNVASSFWSSPLPSHASLTARGDVELWWLGLPGRTLLGLPLLAGALLSGRALAARVSG